MKSFEHVAVIEKPLKDVYALAREVERYPEFLPGYLESRIIGEQAGALLLQRKAHVQGRAHSWQSRVRFENDSCIQFEHAAGPLEGMNVRWTFTPLSEKHTRLSIVHRFSLKRRDWAHRLWVALLVAPRIDRMASQIIEAFKTACENKREQNT